MKVDGRAIAGAVAADVKVRMERLGRVPIVRAVVVKPSPATESYLKIKMSRAETAGMRMEVVRVGDEATAAEVVAALQAPGADVSIVQLPVPEQLDTSAIVNQIPLTQDADVLSDAAYALFDRNEAGALVPPVAAGVWEILERSKVDVTGKKVVVVGRGQLVGKPVATLLARKGALVSVLTRSSDNSEALLKDADIVVSGAGVAHLIKPDMVRPGVVLVDAGTSGSGGGVAGDVDPACESIASLFTPVPGGVGPVAVACLFSNAATLVERGALRN